MAITSSTSDILLYVLAVFIPPIPVFMKTGLGADVLINILLWILGWIPGVIHSWWIIGRHTTPSTSAYGTAATAPTYGTTRY